MSTRAPANGERHAWSTRVQLYRLVRWLPCCAAVLAGMCTQPARAQERAGMTVVVRVCGERDRLALERLHGQSSDLPVSLVAREQAGLEPSFELQLEAADLLAREASAAAVVWFDAKADEHALLVYVATPADGRVLASRVAVDGNADGSGRTQAASALLEQSALVVRFALLGLVKGGAIGVERGEVIARAGAGTGTGTGRSTSTSTSTSTSRSTSTSTSVGPESESDTDSEPDTDSDTEPDSEPDTDSDTEPDSDSSGRPVWLAIGYELAADGFAPAGQHALAARAALSGEHWEAALTAAAGLPAERESAPVGMRLQRLRLAGAFAGRLPLAASWSVAAGVAAGALLQRRTTIGGEEDARARPAQWNAAFVLGPEASVHTRSGALGLLLGAALDVLPSPTRFVLREGDDERAGVQPWRVQPRVFIAAELGP